jgi:hypothetical protein
MEETLEQKCINVLSQKFHERPITCTQIKPELLQQIYDSLGPDLDPFDMARHVVSERYWGRQERALSTATSTDIDSTALSTTAKSSVLQAALQRVIEADDVERMERIELDVVVEHVFALRLVKVPLSIDLSTTLTSLKNLTSLEIELGSAGMPLPNALALGKALPSVQYLTRLSMTNCCLSDDDIQVMKDGMKSITGSPSSCLPPGLISLDVSDNKITAGGLGLLFDMLSPPVGDGNAGHCSVLSSFVAANNCIDEEGARFLATDILPTYTSLKHLNVNLNQLGDVGGEIILSAFWLHHNNGDGTCRRSQLQQVNLAGNGLASKTADSLTELLVGENGVGSLTLTSIDLSLNNLSSEDIANIFSAIERNASRRGDCLLQLHLQSQENYCLDEAAGRDDVARMERCGVRVLL